jgi:hypothetical protein
MVCGNEMMNILEKIRATYRIASTVDKICLILVIVLPIWNVVHVMYVKKSPTPDLFLVIGPGSVIFCLIGAVAYIYALYGEAVKRERRTASDVSDDKDSHLEG